jgi:hypothetical protein
MFWLKLLLGYVVFVFLFVLTFNIVENKIPETTKFKKWWRKYIISTEYEED